MSWFRWHCGSCEDGKFRMVARNANVTVATVMGVWAILLEDASHVDHRGVCVHGEDFYSAVLDLKDGELQAILEAMSDCRLISVGHGAITILKWQQRQFEQDHKDPTAALRQSRYRKRQKALRNGEAVTVTESNGGVTVDVSVSDDRKDEKSNHFNDRVTPSRNGSVTAEKRPDTDTEKKEPSLRSGRARASGKPGLDDLDPEEFRSLAEAEGRDVDRELASFRDYCRAKGKTYRDYRAAFRNWLKSPYGRQTSPPTSADRTAASILRTLNGGDHERPRRGADVLPHPHALGLRGAKDGGG